ncbi:hypothetical protein [Neisseria lactamica]|uniref:hypothetical protein n=1 Tax=Neisseria lactamica TaxID=486 RepID=UPI003BA08E12
MFDFQVVACFEGYFVVCIDFLFGRCSVCRVKFAAVFFCGGDFPSAAFVCALGGFDGNGVFAVSICGGYGNAAFAFELDFVAAFYGRGRAVAGCGSTVGGFKLPA